MAQNSNSNLILAFDNTFILVAIFNSCYTASKITGIYTQQIMRACEGKLVAAKEWYWRKLNSDVYVVDCDDIGKLTLFQFDAESGEDRRIYRTRDMKKSDIMLESEYKNRYKRKWKN